MKLSSSPIDNHDYAPRPAAGIDGNNSVVPGGGSDIAGNDYIPPAAPIDSADYVRSPGYLGSKAASGAYQAIIGLMPPHDTYIETHLGSGAILLRKPKSLESFAIDIDEKTISDFLSRNRELTDATIVHGNCHEFIERYDFTGSELIYSDPPYLPETRTSNAKYRYEYSIDDHSYLCELLKNVNASVLLSGYPNAMYDDALKGWNTYEFQVMTRGGVRTEKLWFNYEPDAVFWSKYAGKDFTDRQRIKRKAERWAKKYAALPPGEKQAIMAAMLKTGADIA